MLFLYLLPLASLWFGCLHVWRCPRTFLIHSLCFFFFSPLMLVPSFCTGWLFISSLCSKSLIWFLAYFTLLLFPCKLFFISISVFFISGWILFMLLRSSLSSLSILVTSAWTLHLIDYLSPFHLALFFLEFWSVLSFGPYFFFLSVLHPPCVCVCVLGRAALTPFPDTLVKLWGAEP